MASASTLSSIKVVDTDSHVVEPADLWTSRVPAKYRDQVPHVEYLEKTGLNHWKVGDQWLTPTGQFSFAGSKVYPPNSFNINMEDGDPGAYDAKARLERLDEYGVYAQVLYPNLIGFEPGAFIDLGHDLSIMCTQAYNDFLIDWSSADSDRLIPIAMVPFWDIDASLAEIRRAKEIGHKGILFANKFERIGFPEFTDEHWDPIYALCNELDLSVNFHIGFGVSDTSLLQADSVAAWAAQWNAPVTARLNVIGQMTNGDCLSKILTSKLPSRFPNLPLVMVESGMGYVPFLLESLDWHWKGYGADRVQPGPLPSEVFRRQCYGTFWFERGTLVLLEQYPDNFMFETDYPHPTSLSPGPCSPADLVGDHIAAAFASVPDDVARKALRGNAARIYHLD